MTSATLPAAGRQGGGLRSDAGETPLQGVVSALVTPFDDSGALDCAGLAANVRHQLACGVTNFGPLGGTGEPISMTAAERFRVVDAVMAEARGQGRVVVGCLLPSQAEIVELGRYARQAGADAIMVIPPYFVGAQPANVKRHFADIASAVDLPMVLFNGPTRCGVTLDARLVVELATDIPHFVALKEATGDLHAASRIVREAPARFVVLQGYDELVLPTLAIGGVGCFVSLACLIPRTLARLHQAFDAGDIVRARELQLRILPIAEAIYAESNPGPLKYAMNLLGLPGGRTRPPLYPVSEATAERIRGLVPEISLLEDRP
ncbi:MAG: dihydrodipicolinate synthase family protein [Reyranellaceae bacterium]